MERLWLTHSGGTVYLIYPEATRSPVWRGRVRRLVTDLPGA